MCMDIYIDGPINTDSCISGVSFGGEPFTQMLIPSPTKQILGFRV